MAWVFVRYAAKGSPLYGLEREARASRRGIGADDHPVAPRFAVFGPRQHCHTQPTGRLQTVTPVLRYGTLPAPTALISYGWEEPPVTDPMQTINAKAKETALAMLGLTVLAIQGFERAFALVYLHHRTAVRVGPRLTPTSRWETLTTGHRRGCTSRTCGRLAGSTISLQPVSWTSLTKGMTSFTAGRRCTVGLPTMTRLLG